MPARNIFPRAMHSLTLWLLVFGLVAAACSSEPEAIPDVTAEPEAIPEAVPDAPAEPETPAEPEPESASDPSGKPSDINFPGVAPAELTITVLIPGDGPLADVGDSVVVDYVGVRSLDGVEFDTSYGRAPFSVSPLGTAGVIQGWNDGLLGAQTGSRIQLDIPSDLAYGETSRSDVIRESEPLTFVIDVRAVITPSDPTDAPSEAGVELSEGATELVINDLITGDGEVVELGQTAVFDLLLFRADTGELLDSTWGMTPLQILLGPNGFPAIVRGLPGMAIGGRRAITFPPDMGFGPDGSPDIELPPEVDAIIVIDLRAIF